MGQIYVQRIDALEMIDGGRMKGGHHARMRGKSQKLAERGSGLIETE